MTTDQAIKHYGSQAKLASALWHCTQPSIAKWGERPPMLRQFEIQLKTMGRLVAELPKDSK
jgi:hypothetical protein